MTNADKRLQEIEKKAWKQACDSMTDDEKLEDIDYINMRVEYLECLYKMSLQTVEKLNKLPYSPVLEEAKFLYGIVHSNVEKDLSNIRTLQLTTKLLRGGKE